MSARMKLKYRMQLVRAAFTGNMGSSGPAKIRYSSAFTHRLMRGWNAFSTSVNDVLTGQLSVLRARSRELVENSGEAEGLLRDFESDVVGPVGAVLQFRARKPRGQLVESLNKRVEEQFWLWSRMGSCTIDGQYSLPQLQRVMFRTVVVDGEFLALRRRSPDFAHGYALQPLDADQLDVNYNVSRNASTGVAIVMGVEVDRYGRHIAYHIWDGHPAGMDRGERRRYPRDEVIHSFKRLRVGQTRGVPWFAPALINWRLGEQYTEAELVQAMLAAAQGGFFVNKNEGDLGSAFPTRKVVDPATGEEREVPLEFHVEPGVSRALPPGWEWQQWTPVHPTANYGNFMTAVKRTVARAFGRSYATLTGDLTAVNFSSIRTDRVREMEQNKLLQDDILVQQFMEPVFLDWYRMAVLSGVLGAVDQTSEQVAIATTWMCRGWPWIDPLKDGAAKKLALEMRTTSPQRLCAELGVDFYEVIDEIAEAQAYAKEKGVSMEAVGLAISLSGSTPDNEETRPDRGLRLTAVA